MAKDKTVKTFSIGGTTIFNGVQTLRLANGKLNLRRNMLKHTGHEDIELVELPRQMTKQNAYAWLLANGYKGMVPTRAADKTKKPAIQIAAEERAKMLRKKKREKAAKAA